MNPHLLVILPILLILSLILILIIIFIKPVRESTKDETDEEFWAGLLLVWFILSIQLFGLRPNWLFDFIGLFIVIGVWKVCNVTETLRPTWIKFKQKGIKNKVTSVLMAPIKLIKIILEILF